MRKQRMAVSALAVLTLAACGTESGSGPGDGSGTVRTRPPITDVRWNVDSLTVDGRRTAAPAPAHVEIGSKGRATGNLGCNHFTAEVVVEGDTVTVGPATSTEMGCEKDVQQFEKAMARAFSGTLEAVVADSPRNGDDETRDAESTNKTLTLTTPKGDSITLTAERPAPLTGTAWKVTGLISGQVATSLPDGARDKGRVTFGEDGSVEGSLGCNSFHGRATVSGSTITFGPLASTRKMCQGPETELERAMLGVLDGRTEYKIDHRALTLVAKNGKGLSASAPDAGKASPVQGPEATSGTG